MIGGQISNRGKSAGDNAVRALDELSELRAGRDNSAVDIDGGAGKECGDVVLIAVCDNCNIGVVSSLVVGELDGDGWEAAGNCWGCGSSGSEEGKSGGECGLHFDGW